jgi:type II secretory pathway pseudopilin PulG
LSRTRKLCVREDAFSLVELMIVMILMVLILSIGVLIYAGSSRSTDLKATAEMVKQDIRKVYAAADSAVAVQGSDGLLHKDQYQIAFNLYTDNPASCYHVYKRAWNVGSGAYNAWTLVAPSKLAANKVISNEWIKPSTSSDIQIRAISGSASPKEITFLSKGSIIQTDAAGDVQVTLRSNSQNKQTVLTVSIFGSVE